MNRIVSFRLCTLTDDELLVGELIVRFNDLRTTSVSPTNNDVNKKQTEQ